MDYYNSSSFLYALSFTTSNNILYIILYEQIHYTRSILPINWGCQVLFYIFYYFRTIFFNYIHQVYLKRGKIYYSVIIMNVLDGSHLQVPLLHNDSIFCQVVQYTRILYHLHQQHYLHYQLNGYIRQKDLYSVQDYAQNQK